MRSTDRSVRQKKGCLFWILKVSHPASLSAHSPVLAKAVDCAFPTRLVVRPAWETLWSLFIVANLKHTQTANRTRTGTRHRDNTSPSQQKWCLVMWEMLCSPHSPNSSSLMLQGDSEANGNQLMRKQCQHADVKISPANLDLYCLPRILWVGKHSCLRPSYL